MMEFNVKIRIDTQDPELAYTELMAILRFNGLDYDVSDEWKLNNRPLPSEVARELAENYGAAMERDHEALNLTSRVISLEEGASPEKIEEVLGKSAADRWQAYLREINKM